MDEQQINVALLRDYLAKDRTLLANERTFLAWVRTAIMLGVSGVTLIKLLGHEISFMIIGVILLPAAGTAVLLGYLRFLSMRRQISDKIRLAEEELQSL